MKRTVAVLEGQGHTAVVVGDESGRGYIALRDRVRPEAGVVVGSLAS